MTDMNVREAALVHEGKQFKKITELDKFDLSWPIYEGKAVFDGVEKEYHYVLVLDEEVRVPSSVLSQIKKILELKPETQFVQVASEGTGLQTKYMTVPM